jgi:membrane protein implicated in regulation of membrane protease activity
MLAVAAFVAFNLFYVFAGAPSLALVPGARRLVAFAVPIVATFVLVRRWSRHRTTSEPTKRKLPVLTR